MAQRRISVPAVLLSGLALALLPLVALAQSAPPTLQLDGNVRTPMRFDGNTVRQLTPVHVNVVYGSAGGTVKANFGGATLWSLIIAAGGIADTGHGAEVRHAIKVTATDGYVVVLSTGEIAPDVGAKEALIAYERDGKPTGNFWLVMPGDKGDARYVHDVTSITIN